MNDKQLLFLISQPRSGSTLLQAILSNHDQIHSRSEHWLLLPFLGLFKKKFNNAVYDSFTASELLKKYLVKNDLMSHFNQDLISFLKKQYSYILDNGAGIVLDKTPRYYEILEEIQSFFPGAKIIILKRNPLDVLLSLIEKKKNSYLTRLAFNYRDLFEAPHIIQSFCEKNNHNSNVYVLRYEDLINETETEIKNVLNWLGLVYDKNVLKFYDSKVLSKEVGDQKILATKDIKINTLNRWRETSGYFETNMILGYYNYLGMDFLCKYGYDNITLDSKSTAIFNFFRNYFNPHPKIHSNGLKYKILKSIYSRFI